MEDAPLFADGVAVLVVVVDVVVPVAVVGALTLVPFAASAFRRDSSVPRKL